jgi:hypothetical protein
MYNIYYTVTAIIYIISDKMGICGVIRTIIYAQDDYEVALIMRGSSWKGGPPCYTSSLIPDQCPHQPGYYISSQTTELIFHPSMVLMN